jgi:nitroreductase
MSDTTSTVSLAAAMAEAANLAPSIHNSQPWKFAITLDGIEVLTDEARATPAIDPLGRSMRLACGAAVLNALVTARAAGRSCTVVLTEHPDQSDVVAVLTLGDALTPDPEDIALARAVAERHTARTAFEPEIVPATVVDKLRAAVEHEGGWLHVLSRPEDIIELAVLTERAEADERADEGYVSELETWMRTAGDNTEDGILLDLIPADGPSGRGSDVTLRDFHGRVQSTGDGSQPSDGPPPVERPLLVIVGTDGDRPIDWIRAGMAMQRLWLTATAAGLGASPISQALDHSAPRMLLSRLVGLENGHPQMLLRIGYCQSPPVTGRRPIADVLVHH